MSFPTMKLTIAGKALLAKAHKGEQLNFTKISIGSGTPPASVDSAYSLSKEEFSLDITKIYVNEGIAHITAILDNTSIIKGFRWSEIGLYAGDVLYAYANAGELAEYIPPYTDASFYRTKIGIAVLVAAANNVTASLGEYAGYVTHTEFDEHLLAANPHGITPETIGLRITEDGFLQYLKDNKWLTVQQQPNIYFHGTGHTTVDRITVEIYECESEEQMDDTTFLLSTTRIVSNGEISLTTSVNGYGTYRAVITLNHTDDTLTTYTHVEIIKINDSITYNVEI